MNKINDLLYISDNITAHDYDLLKFYGIKQILIVCPTNELSWHKSKDFKYMRIKILDLPNSPIHSYFLSSFNFINNSPTLVHCLHGISRSATICISYLMKSCNLSFQQAFNILKSIRPIINPNYGFINKLISFEHSINLIT